MTTNSYRALLYFSFHLFLKSLCLSFAYINSCILQFVQSMSYSFQVAESKRALLFIAWRVPGTPVNDVKNTDIPSKKTIQSLLEEWHFSLIQGLNQSPRNTKVPDVSNSKFWRKELSNPPSTACSAVSGYFLKLDIFLKHNSANQRAFNSRKLESNCVFKLCLYTKLFLSKSRETFSFTKQSLIWSCSFQGRYTRINN